MASSSVGGSAEWLLYDRIVPDSMTTTAASTPMTPITLTAAGARRRRLALGACATLMVPALPAWSQFRVEISGVGATQLPIVITRFRDEDRSGTSLSGIVR